MPWSGSFDLLEPMLIIGPAAGPLGAAGVCGGGGAAPRFTPGRDFETPVSPDLTSAGVGSGTTRSRYSGKSRSCSNGPILLRAALTLLASPSNPSFRDRRMADVAPLTVR